MNDDPACRQALERAQQEFQNIRHALDESAIVAITDRRGVITYVNDMFCAISQYSREELIGQTHRLIKSGEHPREFFETLWKTISSGRVWRGTIKNRAKDGSFYWMNATITPLMGPDGKPDRYVAIRSDITAQKKLEGELRLAKDQALEAARAKAEFLANMSHEIRTPLNGILGMTSLLEKTPLTAEQKQCAEVIRTSGDALLSLINDLLDFSKMESGKLDLEDIPMSMEKLASDAIRITLPAAQRKGITVAYVPAPGTPAGARGDPTRIRQILLNLVGNAVKFTAQGSVTIKTGLVANGGRVRFEVVDTGIGLSEPDRQKLFQPFTQVDGSITRRFGGTGLGLAICRKLVDRMGGSIGVDSVPGRGSTFWFEIPYRPAEPPVEKPTDFSSLPPTLSDARPLLVVDDNETNRLVMCALLAKMGHRSETAADGQAALERAGQQTYCAILMDCQMPGMDGYQTARELRARERGRIRTPIIGVTAHVLDGDREKVIAAGMDDYLPKPVQIGDLSACLARWIAGGHSAPTVNPLKTGEVLDQTVLDEIKDLKTADGKSVLERVLDTFQKTLPGYIQEIKTAAAQEDLAKIKAPAHTLKGSSRSIGAERLGKVCASLLKACAENRTDLIPPLLADLEKESTALDQALRQRKSR
jgi:PAS domain S-box-containing protein